MARCAGRPVCRHFAEPALDRFYFELEHDAPLGTAGARHSQSPVIAELGAMMNHHGTSSSIALCNIAHYAGNLELILFADLISVKSLDFCLDYRMLGGMSASARGFESNPFLLINRSPVFIGHMFWLH